MARSGLVYQPALDGIRAIAVLAVLAFHGEVAGFSGGYLGVSVFFTLSGFLITSVLISEHDRSGRIAVGSFFVRRAKRLLPASIVCLLAVAALSATTDLFAGVSNLRRDLLGALFQVANWVFLAGEGSYQQLFAEAAGQASPLEHYWSLAIEEQFYWIWPLAFIGVYRLARTHRARIRVVGAATVAFAIAAPLIAWRWGADAAYWATPARIAEILVGAFAAFIITGRSLAVRWSYVAPVTLTILAAAVITFPAAGGPAYRGALPLVGIVSAVLIVSLQVPGRARTALSVAPLVWLGRISYGVYLFHWPVFVIIDSPRVDLDGPLQLITRLAVTLVLAQTSMILIESPIRASSTWPARRVASGAAFATACVATVAVVLVPEGSSDYWRDRNVASAAAIDTVSDEPLSPLLATTIATAPVIEADSASTTAPVPTTTTDVALPVLTRPVRIVVAGDSTAEATGFGLAYWATNQPELAQVSILTEKGCGFVRGGELLVQEWQRVESRCDTWLDRSLVEDVTALQPDVVMLMTTSWDVLDRRWTPEEQLSPLDEAFANRLADDFAMITQRLLDAGAAHVVWVREPVPNVFWWSSGQTQEDPRRHEVLYSVMADLATAQPERVSVIDLALWLDEQRLSEDHDARPDGVHWSPEAATLIATEFLGEQLIRATLGL